VILPRARSVKLVVEPLDGETLVYDLRRHRAHCLNRTASLVWSGCDGRTSVAAMGARLERELAVSDGETLVWTALDQLARARLLEHPPALPPARSRRDLLRALGLGAAASALLPVVESIVSPLAAQAASCLTDAECTALVPPQCTGQPICGSPGDCCVARGKKCQAKRC
jgi:hypothetical protein